MHLAKYNVDLFLTLKRSNKAAKKRRRAVEHKNSGIRAGAHRRGSAGFFGDHSRIAEMLSEGSTKELSVPQTSLRLIVPETFSMLDAPEVALNLISAFALTHKNKPLSDVFVDFSRVTKQDLGAHALLDKLVDEMVAQTAYRNQRLSWKGNFPKGAAQQRFIQAMGIIRQLGLSHRYLATGDAAKIHLFERRCRHYLHELRARKPEDKTEQANAAERFANHVNKCLSREGRELTPAARSALCTYVVEIIDNAENHAGMVDWTIQGYLDTASQNPECEIVIFNFGQSIAATLQELPPGSYTKEQIQRYLDLHGSNGWFSPGWRRDDLLTLIALQGSVSSKNTSTDSTRGQGTADLIEFFQKMNDERQVEQQKLASMYIISGSTRILFDGRYRMKKTDDGSRVIAFNDSNDLLLPPDPSCVKPLDKAVLPGTMIGIKFSVQALSLQQPQSSAGTPQDES
jgi:hypothetical protein